MKKISIFEILEKEGYQVLNYDDVEQCAKIKVIKENKNLPKIFECKIDLELNGYGDLVITLYGINEEGYVKYDNVFECLEYREGV